MSDKVLIIGGAMALGALYFFYRPIQTMTSGTAVAPVPPTVPMQQNPNSANAFCKQAVGAAATGVATFYGGAAGGAAAQSTGASSAAGVGVCATVAKVQSAQQQFTSYVANALPPSVAAPFKTIADNAIQTSNPFYDVQHPVDAAKSIAGATANAAKSIVSTIGSWF